MSMNMEIQKLGTDFFENKKALIIDDQEFVRTIVTKILDKIGFGSIHAASDGEEGLKLTKEERPDIVICDLKMENMNGLQFLEALRHDEDKKLRATPVIILTGEVDQSLTLSAHSHGVDAIVLKPVSVDNMHEKLSMVMQWGSGD